MASLRLSNICKSFGSTDVIKGVDLEINDGEFVVFVGPSGCGKSTLLRLIAGLEDITNGTLEIGGRRVNELEPKERGIGMVFQSYAIFPHMSVRENMAFGLTIRKEDQVEIERRVAEAARMLKMENLLDRRPSQLSGGQRQRVAIGRAVVRAPDVFLFDEPLSNLDAALRMNTRMEIAELHKRLGSTMIYVTHDQVEAMTLADRIVVLKDGEVQQYGKPMELYHEPANEFVGRFIGSPPMNFFEASVTASDSGRHELVCDALPGLKLDGEAYRDNNRVSLGIRPQYLSLSKGQDTDIVVNGKITFTERLGGETVIGVVLQNDHPVVALHSEDIELISGNEITFYCPINKVRVFDH